MASEAKQDSTFNAAKQLYAEQFGDAIVTNTYLKIALLVMALVAGGLIYTNIKTVRTVENFKPLVIRINDIGRAEAVRYDTLGYKPQDAEIKYFLSDFCRMYYSRNHYTVRDNFKRSLLFMEAQLANSVAEAYRKNHTIENYLRTPAALTSTSTSRKFRLRICGQLRTKRQWTSTRSPIRLWITSKPNERFTLPTSFSSSVIQSRTS